MNNRDIRCEICSKLTIKTSERRQWLLYSCYYYYFLLILLLFIVPFRRSFQKNYISWGKHRSIKYSRGVFRTHSNIYDKAFCANCQWLVAVNYFPKKYSIKDVDRVLNRILNYLDGYWFGMNKIERYSQQKRCPCLELFWFDQNNSEYGHFFTQWLRLWYCSIGKKLWDDCRSYHQVSVVIWSLSFLFEFFQDILEVSTNVNWNCINMWFHIQALVAVLYF